jgi:hypothetical protein
MFPFDKQVVTVIRQGKVGTDTTDEPPLWAGFGISERPSRAPMRPRAHDSGAGRWAQPHALSHHNDVRWHIISGRTWQIQQKSDHIEVILEAVYVPSGANHD